MSQIVPNAKTRRRQRAAGALAAGQILAGVLLRADKYAARPNEQRALRNHSEKDPVLLHELIHESRREVVARCAASVASRLGSSRASDAELEQGTRLFVEELVEMLRTMPAQPGPAFRDGAAALGRQLLRRGFSIVQMVQSYAGIRESFTELALERNVSVSAHELHMLHRCIDDAIGSAVSEHELAREREETERLGFLAHELRNQLNSATLAFELLKTASEGTGMDGSSAAVLGRSLRGLRSLIDRELARVRLGAGVYHREDVLVREFIEEVAGAATLDARARGVHFTVASLTEDVSVHADRQLIGSVLANLLQNAFKFTRRGGNVQLRARTTDDRLFLDVEDECGGLPPGRADDLFRPFEQRGRDRTGLGLGLGLCYRGAQASDAEIHVSDRPGVGCSFTFAIPCQRGAPQPI